MKANGTKRAAFNDVSNVTRAITKDDIQIGKSKESAVLKDSAAAPTKEAVKPSTLLRPAQRPLASKTNTTATSEHATAPISRSSALDGAQPRKTLLKKATTVFRETHADALPTTSSTTEASTRQSVRKVVDPPYITNDRAENAPLPSVVSEKTNAPRQRRDSAPADNQIRIDVHDIAKTDTETRPAHTQDDTQEKVEYVDAVEGFLGTDADRNAVAARSQASWTTRNDQEYWDEGEEEYYDADGYTTARSLRTRGDYTTQGLTIVLGPSCDPEAERELEAAKLWVEANKTPEDIEDEQWDTSMVAEYGDEIFEYMHSLEERMKPNANYMDSQAEIQWSMRSVLMDWMVQVHNRFSLLPETLFLAVNYVDRFLSAKVVSLGKLQLVGATALFLAAKYEEINCPSVQEIVYMVDGAYTVEEVLKAERFMLSMLKFELGWPGPMSFLRRVSKADDYDVETRTLAKYFLELTIMDERFVGCTPSYLAAGAHCFARFMLKKGEWVSYYTLIDNRFSANPLLDASPRPLLRLYLRSNSHASVHHAAMHQQPSEASRRSL